MIEDFKKRLCKKAGLMNYYLVNNVRTDNEELILLIKAMWAINREGKWHIKMENYCIAFYSYMAKEYKEIIFKYKDHNNSEQEALQKALEYIYEQDNE